MELILAGDVGGTKTLLEIGTLQNECWQPLCSRRYTAADFADIHDVLRTFFREWTMQRHAHSKLARACLGVAGPAFDNRAQMTNLPWTVDGNAISTEFKIPLVRIVNDFAAAASGVEILAAADRVVLQPGVPMHGAPRLVIGAGTGLGVAFLISTGGEYRVVPGEAGHAGFAPTTLEQVDLWCDISLRQGRVTAEDLVSGPGLVRIYEFLERTAGGGRENAMTAPTRITPELISLAALEAGDPISVRALDIFIKCYGEVAGNLALAVLAYGGIFVTGGIAPKIISRLLKGEFLAAFNAKGSYSDIARRMPVCVVTSDRLGLFGAALIAARSSTSVM